MTELEYNDALRRISEWMDRKDLTSDEVTFVDQLAAAAEEWEAKRFFRGLR